MSTVQEKELGTNSAQGPLFVVGMWRSGTSLFYALLNQHPQIALMYEGDLPLLWPLFLGSKAKADWPERWEFWNSAPIRHEVSLTKLPRNASSLAEACTAGWKEYAGDGIYGCKSPNYFDMLPGLAKQFPNARFIIIWRNPADICRSVMRASKGDSFFAKRGMVLRALRGYQELKKGFDTLVARGAQIHAVQYEQLVSDPTEVMSGVCRFLELEFEPRMVNLRDADRSAIYDGGHHEGVNSESIAPKKPKAESLPPTVIRKIERYVSAWHWQYAGKWPAVPETSSLKPSVWFGIERIFDSLLYRGFRALDSLIVFIYCFAPLALLKKYRTLRGRGETVAVQQKPLVSAPVKE